MSGPAKPLYPTPSLVSKVIYGSEQASIARLINPLSTPRAEMGCMCTERGYTRGRLLVRSTMELDSKVGSHGSINEVTTQLEGTASTNQATPYPPLY